MASTTNYSWSTPDNTALVKDGAAAIRSLGSAIDSTVFTNASAAIAKTIVDAKGDIIAATAADTVARLAVGSNDQVLIADSTTATGLKWGTPASGGMSLIQTITPNQATSVSFTSIPTNYKQLFVYFYNVWQNYGGDSVVVRLNNSSASVYSMFSIEKFTSSIGANVYGDATQIDRVFQNTGTNTTPKRNLITGYFKVYNANEAVNHGVEFWSGGLNASDVATGTSGRGMFYPTTGAAITRLDFINLSSQGMSGTFELYGVN